METNMKTNMQSVFIEDQQYKDQYDEDEQYEDQ